MINILYLSCSLWFHTLLFGDCEYFSFCLCRSIPISIAHVYFSFGSYDKRIGNFSNGFNYFSFDFDLFFFVGIPLSFVHNGLLWCQIILTFNIVDNPTSKLCFVLAFKNEKRKAHGKPYNSASFSLSFFRSFRTISVHFFFRSIHQVLDIDLIYDIRITYNVCIANTFPVDPFIIGNKPNTLFFDSKMVRIKLCTLNS